MKYLFKFIFIILLSLAPDLVTAGKEYVDFSGVDFSNDTSKKISMVKQEIDKSDHIKAIGFTKNKLTSEIFAQITQSMPLHQFKSLRVLDLEDNFIDRTAALTIARWLQLDSQPTINLYNNRVRAQNIKNLCDALLENFSLDKVKEFMKRVIFTSEGNITRASKTTQTYKTLVSEGKLASEWPAYHRNFYKSEDYKCLVKMRKLESDKESIRQMYRVLRDSPQEDEKPDELIADSEDEEDNDFPDEAFITALASLNVKSPDK